MQSKLPLSLSLSPSDGERERGFARKISALTVASRELFSLTMNPGKRRAPVVLGFNARKCVSETSPPIGSIGWGEG